MKESLLSVGIDLGTSTTQLVFSKLTIENLAGAFAVPRMEITEKTILYRSGIYFTPLLNQNSIDFPKVREIIEAEYEKAGIQKSEIDTGAVIITGETARKENAREVVNTLSGFAGDFVVATAGPDLESVISGKGAGTDVYSKDHHVTAVNIDIGGGTSNLSVFQSGETRDVGCLDVGGRLVKMDKTDGKITYIAPKLKEIIQKEKLPLSEGVPVHEDALSTLIHILVQALEQSVGLRSDCPYYQYLITNQGLSFTEGISCISFSGGVADAVYHPEKFSEPFPFGDMGLLLGKAIRDSRLCTDLKVIESAETIRATVVGAGSHTTKISGSTITYTRSLFPIKNLPVLKLSKEEEAPQCMAKSIQKKAEWFRVEDRLEPLAVAFAGDSNPSFSLIQEYAHGLLGGMEAFLKAGLPLIVVVEEDMAKVLGQTLYHLLNWQKEIICLDGVSLREGEYIDIGKPAAEGQILPVVVKTLAFHS